MKVYYAFFYPILHFVLALLLFTLVIIAYVWVDRYPWWVELCFTGILILRGILFFRIPYFELSEKELKIYNRFGRAYKVYRFNSWQDFHWEGNKLFVIQKGKSKKVKVSRIFVSIKKWKAFRSVLNHENLKSELH